MTVNRARPFVLYGFWIVVVHELRLYYVFHLWLQRCLQQATEKAAKQSPALLHLPLPHARVKTVRLKSTLHRCLFGPHNAGEQVGQAKIATRSRAELSDEFSNSQ